MPAAHALERLLPDALVRSAIEKADDASSLIAGRESIRRRAGVRDLEELKHEPMEKCDALAERVELMSESIAALERPPAPAASSRPCSISRSCSPSPWGRSARSAIAMGTRSIVPMTGRSSWAS